MPKKTNKLNKKTETSKKVKAVKNNKRASAKKIKKTAGNSKKNKAVLSRSADNNAIGLNGLNQTQNNKAVNPAGGKEQNLKAEQNVNWNIPPAQQNQNNAAQNDSLNGGQNKAGGQDINQAENKAEKQEQTPAQKDGQNSSGSKMSGFSDFLKNIDNTVIHWNHHPSEHKAQEPAQPFDTDDYIDEIIQIAAMKDRNSEEKINRLKQWRKKAEEHAAQIPFEQYMAQFKLSLPEWLLLCKFVHNALSARTYSNNKESLVEYLFAFGIWHIKEIRQVLSKDGNLFKNRLIAKQLGSYGLAPDVYKKLFDLDDNFSEKSEGNEDTDEKEAIFPLDLAEEVKKSVIGQDEAVESICAAVYEHYLRCKSGRTDYKNNVLLLGPTGTGKTFLCHTLAKLLKIPFQATNITQYTESGYVGFDIGDILYGLAKKANLTSKKDFPFSIVYIDEVDKLRISHDKINYDKGIGVQQELLKMLESNEYTCLPKDKFSPPQKFNISKVLFILGGAFVGLEDIIAKRLNKHGIGFGSSSSAKSEIKDFKNVTSEDLAKFGVMPEMIGRISSRIALNNLEEKDLIRILKYGKDSVLEDYIKLYESAGIKLTVTDEELHKIAALALKQGTGARGLAAIVSQPLSYTLFKSAVRDIKEISFEEAQKLYYMAQYLAKIKECTAQDLPSLFEKIYENEGLTVCADILTESMAAEVYSADREKRGMPFYFKALEFLFEKGFSPDARLMEIAVTSADTALLKMCLNYGGNPDERVFITGTDKSENLTCTLLHQSCLPDIPAECLELLLKKGADIKQTSSSGFTPFMWACVLGASTAKLELLLKNGADIKEPLPDGKSLLLASAENRNTDTVRFLLEHGVKIDLNNPCDSQIAAMAQDGELTPEISEIILAYCGGKRKRKGTDK